MLTMVAFMGVSSTNAAGPNKRTCSVTDCFAGTKAITHASKQDPYYACPSRELADYTNVFVGLIALHVTFTGHLPNISDKTGEPEWQGETKTMVDSLRDKARVSGFNQASSLCTKGLNKIRVTVLNNPSGSEYIYVMNEKNNKTFWLPKTFLDKR
jgi:hypothetical protein